MAKAPTDDDKKRPGKAPAKPFDPKTESWQNRGKAQFKDRKPTNASRPFKGGGRGR